MGILFLDQMVMQWRLFRGYSKLGQLVSGVGLFALGKGVVVLYFCSFMGYVFTFFSVAKKERENAA